MVLMYERMTIIFQGKLQGWWAPGRAGRWHQYWVQKQWCFFVRRAAHITLTESSVISCSCIGFALWLSAGDLMLSLGFGFFTYDSIRRRSEWISRGRLQRMGWAIALSSSNRTYPGHNFVATGAVNLQLLGRETTFSIVIVHASLIVRIYSWLFK